MKKTESGVTTYYVISSVLGSVLEVTSSGVQRAYVMSGSSVVAQLNPNGSFYWLHQDHLGSGRKMTDSAGNMVYRAEFDPYGKLLYEWSSPSNLNSRKFTGYERDAATNLDYAQARMYSSDWGRFMSVDKLGLTGARMTSPKSLNRYSYASGDPINRVDRNGMEDVPLEWSNLGPIFNLRTTEFAPTLPIYRDFGLGGQFMIEDPPVEGPIDGGEIREKLLPCASNFLGQYKELRNVDIDNVNMYPGALPSAEITGIFAMTLGNNIFFAPGKYSLTYDGIALIAHELYHVKQYNDVGGIGNFLRQYFSEFKANLEKRVGPIEDFPTPPIAPGDGPVEAGPFLAKLGAILARLSKEDIDAAYSNISFEVTAREFERKVRREVEANGSPCIP